MRRVLVTFWVLIAVAILSFGGMSRAVAAPPSALTGAWFLGTALIAAVSAFLAARIFLALSRPR